MQIEKQKISVQFSEGFQPKESSFGIGDEAIVMGILRDKLYTNKIRAICQEIMSNARDAQREIGHPEIPIQVCVPNSLSPEYKVKDFGPGISPDRMENVFIKFGSSTKRKDNVQTGGFGLGAKSPFAYTDTFSIITNTLDSNGKMMQRSYTAYLDESGKGKMALINEVETTEPSGTTIVLPVKPDDFNSFYEWTIAAARFWTPKPDVQGIADHKWEKIKKTASGSNWGMYEIPNSGRGYYNYDKVVLLTIDEIPYELQWHSLSNLSTVIGDEEIYNRVQKIYDMGCYSDSKIVIDFKTGELALNASREQVEYTPECIKKIASRLVDVAKEVKDSIATSFETMPSLLDAIKSWKSLSSYMHGVVGEVEWQGKKVQDQYAILPASSAVIHVYNRMAVNIKQKSNTKTVDVAATNVKTFINYTQEYERRRVYTVFDNDRSLHSVRVICFPSQSSYDEAIQRLKDNVVQFGGSMPDVVIHNQQEDIGYLNKTIYLDDLSIPDISLIPKREIARSSNNSAGRSMPVAYTYQHGDNSWSPIYDEEDVDFANGEGVYVPLESRNPVSDNYQAIEIAKGFGLNVIGVPKRNMSKLGSGWIRVVDAIQKKAEEIADEIIPLVKEIGDYKNAHEWSFAYQLGTVGDTIVCGMLKHITDPIFKEYRDLSLKVETYQSRYTRLENLKFHCKDQSFMENLKSNDKGSTRKYYDAIMARYPMLAILTGRNSCIGSKEEVILYEYLDFMYNIYMAKENADKVTDEVIATTDQEINVPFVEIDISEESNQLVGVA